MSKEAIVKFENWTNSGTTFDVGYTPLYVALRARKWDTARLILEIAEEQFMGEDDQKVKTANPGGNVIQFGPSNHRGYTIKQWLTPIKFSDDDDDDEHLSDGDSYASDETEKRPAGYTDLAKRFHTVCVNVKPNQLLSYGAKCAIKDTSDSKGFWGTADPITTAVRENDLEAFEEIADVCRADSKLEDLRSDFIVFS